MNLVIRASKLNDQALSQPITACYDHRGGTIGRSDTNTLALPDPERHISRLQADVSWAGDRYHIKNVGAANPILLNGRALSPGESAPLSDRDELVIGGYALGVRYEGDNQAIRTITQGRAAVDARTVITGSAGEARTGPPRAEPPSPPPQMPAASPVPTPMMPAGDNPFADLLGSAPPGPGAPADADPFAGLGQAFAPAPAPAHAPAPQAPRSASAAPPDPFAADLDPFAGLLAPTPSSAPSSSDRGATPPSGGAPAVLPDDFDPFAAPTGAGAPRRPDAPASANPGDLLGELGVRSAEDASSLDDAFGLARGSAARSSDPLAGFMAGGIDPLSSGGSSGPDLMAGQPPPNTDPLAMFGGAGGAGGFDLGSPGPATPLEDHTPELSGSFAPPRVAAPVAPVPPLLPDEPFEETAAMARTNPGLSVPSRAPAPVPPASVPMAAPAVAPVAPAPRPPAVPQAVRQPAAVPAASARGASQGDTSALWAGFCQGAGLELSLPQGLTPEMMQVVGQILRHSVEGTLRLMAVRAAAKQELRAQVTTIQSRNNNPLKFSPDVQLALEQLLQPPARGFMAGPQATKDAMDDLLGHAIGTMAGMRAALDGVLDRFSPEQLEAKLSGRNMLDSLLPMNRKAKLWDLYLQHFGAIRSDAQDDFHTLFGKAFVAAYEAQLDRLAQQRASES